MNKTQLIGLANEIDEQGWCKICPYGESSKITATKDGRINTYIQVMDQEGAIALANGFNSLWGRMRRAIASVPLFDGHPDLARIDPKQISGAGQPETPVGSINRLEARDNGLYAQVALFPSGQALANDGKKWISPFWWSTETDVRGDIKVVKPVELISGGLTSRPNIEGGEALANTKTVNAGTSNMKPHIIGFLAARGIALANTASDEDCLARVVGITTKLEADLAAANTDKLALANEKTALANEKAALITERDAAKTAATQAAEKATQAATALANERGALSEALVDLAITQGRIALADRDARIKRLKEATDFGAEKTALANESVKHATTGSTDRKGEAKFDASARQQLHGLCNERMQSDKVGFDQAWDAVIADPKNAALVASMRAKS